MLVTIKRVFKSGWQVFLRYSHLSFATCLVLVITISMTSFLFLSRTVLDFLIDDARGKADISVYFEEECPEETMFELKDELVSLVTVQGAEVISREEALERFIAKHKDDESLMESLVEVGANPFLASLNIKAAGVEEYDEITILLGGEQFTGVIEKIDYHRRKPVIEKIFAITDFAGKAGMMVVAVFVITSVVISFNTIRLTIHSQKDEVSVMRLVGANNSFIRGPFLIQGALCGILSFLISLLIVGLSAYFLTPELTAVFPEFQLFDFFQDNLGQLVLIQFLSGLALGIIPSYIAIIKHLQV